MKLNNLFVALLVALTSMFVTSSVFATEWDNDTPPAEKPAPTTTSATATASASARITYERRIIAGRPVYIERRMPLPSGPAHGWARQGVESAEANGLYVGRPGYRGANDPSNQAFATNERVANGLDRTYRKAVRHSDDADRLQDLAAAQREQANQDDHKEIRAQLNLTWQKAFIAAAIVGLILVLMYAIAHL